MLAYPKVLVKIGFCALLISFFAAYLYSRSEVLVKQNAIIVGAEFNRGTTRGERDSLYIIYRYSFKNKIYEVPGWHFLPRGYPRDKINEYVSKWRQENHINSDIKIIVNSWRPNYSKLEEDSSRVWFVDFLTLFILYWIFLMLILASISMAIKYFFIRTRNNV